MIGALPTNSLNQVYGGAARELLTANQFSSGVGQAC
jgi:hypothetical protein